MMPKGTKREPKGSQKGTRRWPMGPKWEPDGVAMRHIDMKNGKIVWWGKIKGFRWQTPPEGANGPKPKLNILIERRKMKLYIV